MVSDWGISKRPVVEEIRSEQSVDLTQLKKEIESEAVEALSKISIQP